MQLEISPSAASGRFHAFTFQFQVLVIKLQELKQLTSARLDDHKNTDAEVQVRTADIADNTLATPVLPICDHCHDREYMLVASVTLRPF